MTDKKTLTCPKCGSDNIEEDDPRPGEHTCRDCGEWIDDEKVTEPRYSVVSEVTFPLPRWVHAAFEVVAPHEYKFVLLAAKDDVEQVARTLHATFVPIPCPRCGGGGRVFAFTNKGQDIDCLRCSGRGFIVTEYGDGDGFDHINEGEREDEAIWQEHQRESEAPYRP